MVHTPLSNLSDPFTKPSCETLDAFMAIAEGQPAAGSADGRQIITTHRAPNTFENVPPADTIPHLQSESLEHHTILVVHPLFRAHAVQRAPGGLLVRTGPADNIGGSEHLDPGFWTVGQGSVD